MRKLSALQSVSGLCLAAATIQPALAWDAAVDDASVSAAQGESASNDTANETIVITGSRIRRTNIDSPVPVTTVDADKFYETGQVSVGDVLNELPALRNTFSTANSTRFLGTSGLNLLDLRGLGTQRTLVLVNGRRHVGSNTTGNAVEVDVNTIPTDLIERVEVVTGGSSAVYGSDAIAGVVNFIMKDHYDGIKIRGQGGISNYGDAGSYYVSALAGTNFADDRGNVAVNLEYARQDDYYASERPNVRINSNFVVVDSDPGGSPNGSDGVPDRTFFDDIRFATLHSNGSVLFASPTGACGRDPNGSPYSCSFVFDDAGNLAPQTGTRVGLAPNGNFIGGNGINNREGKSLGLSPKIDRYSANLLAHIEVSSAFVPFLEAKYVRVDTLGSASGPAFSQGSTIEGDRERPRLDNPFLSAQARAIIESQLVANGVTPTDATQFSLRRNLNDLGDRQEEARRETYRIVAGVRGDIADNWNYEASINYGELDERTKVLGNLNVQRFVLASDAVRDPVSGNIVCRSQIDPDAAFAFPFPNDPAEAERRLADDIAKCVPYNPFGNQNGADVRNYLVQDTVSTGKVSQFVLSGFLSGDTSKFLNLPGGPVGVALGAEYRRDDALYRQDELVQAGLTFYNSIPTFDPPSSTVKEVYGELRLPILSNVPFFHELTLSAAGRIADYNGPTGTVYAYNVSGEWAPVQDFKVRAAYSRAVRAPNLADRFTPQGQNFAPGFVDPCSARNIATGSQFRAANCAAAGIPTDYDFVYSSSLGFLSGGNPDLREETSDSYTLGAVFTPSFLPGFSLTADYYDITVNDVITSPSAQQIADACYDLPDLNNQFCSLFQRAGTGGGPQNEVPFQILEGSLQATLLNYAKLKTRGLDVEASYSGNLIANIDVSTRLTYTHVFQNDEFLDPTNPGFADQLLLELGDPKDAFNWDVDLKSGPWQFGYQMRYIGKQVLNQYEDFFSKQGRPPQNADYADQRFYNDLFYHDVRLGYDINDKINVYAGVDNITNKLPPLGLTGIGGGSGIYDARGRFMYAGASVKF